MVWKLEFFVEDFSIILWFCVHVSWSPCCVLYGIHLLSSVMLSWLCMFLHFLFVCCCLHVMSAVPMQIMIKLCHGRCTRVMLFFYRANFEVIFPVIIGIFGHLSATKSRKLTAESKLALEERNSSVGERAKEILFCALFTPSSLLIPHSHDARWTWPSLWLVSQPESHCTAFTANIWY